MQQFNSKLSLYSQIYDDANNNYVDDVKLVKECLEQTGGPFADLGCATGGRVISPLNECGYECYGVDLDSDMLAVGRAKMGAKAQLIQGDFTSLSLPKPMGTIACIFSTFCQVVDKDKRAQTLKTCADNLKPNGLLLIAIKNDNLAGYDASGSNTRERVIETPYGQLVFTVSWTADVEIRRKTYLVNMRLQTAEGLVEDTVKLENALVSYDEMQEAIDAAGLKLLHLYGDNDKSAYDAAHSLWQIYVLQKK